MSEPTTVDTAVITRYIVEEFLPDMRTGDLAPDYDLLAGGVIDSLALLKVVDWLGERFQLSLDDVELSPDNFRTVEQISAFVAAARAATARA
jgi:acyl carrier protein